MHGSRERVTFRAPDVWFGEFCLPADDPKWSREWRIDEHFALIAFPGPAVAIQQHKHRPLVADRMRAVTYAPSSTYRRAVVSAAGDRCSYISFDTRIAAQAAARFDSAAAADPTSYRFPFPAAGIETRDFLLKQRLRARLRDADVEPGEVRERLFWLIERAVDSGYRELGIAPSLTVRRESTMQEHSDLVEATRAFIGREPGERLSLDEIATGVGVSAFHLSRVFHRLTGESVHGYRTHLRLRSSLERISAGDRLADIAQDLGFSSQAHLADRFRRAYGTSPAAWRRALATGRETSKIMKEARRRVA